jgi:hypothetical protein
MPLTRVDLFLWAASFLGHIVLLLVLWIRNRIRPFPFFTGLVGMNLVRTMMLFAIQHFGTKAQYFYTFWSFAIVDVGLQLSVIYELSHHVFQPHGVWNSIATRRLLWWALGSVTVAASITWIAAPPTTMWAQTLLIKGDFFSAALMSELFAGMIALSVTANLPWSTHAARIAQGLGVYSMATLGIETVRTYFGLERGSHVYADLSHLRIVLYLLCLVYWIVALWRNAAAQGEMPELMRKQLRELRCESAQRAQTLQSWRQP